MSNTVEMLAIQRCKCDPYTLLFNFSLTCKANAVKKIILVKDQLRQCTLGEWAVICWWCFKTKEMNKRSTLLLPKYPSLAKPVTLLSASQLVLLKTEMQL